MVGALPASATMQPRPVGRGYVKLRETTHHPWPQVEGKASYELPVHEFHYSQLDDLDEGVDFAYDVVRGTGIRDSKDGLIHRNTLATYSHHRNVGDNHWAERFVRHIRCGMGDQPFSRKAAV